MYVHRKIRSYMNVLYTTHLFGRQPSLDITNLLRQSPKVYYDKGLLYAFSFISFSMEHTAWNVLQKATENSILVQLLIFTTVYICYHLEHDCCNVFIMMTTENTQTHLQVCWLRERHRHLPQWRPHVCHRHLCLTDAETLHAHKHTRTTSLRLISR